jgi:hypothetical protein
MDSIAIWLTTTPGLVSIIAFSLVIGVAGLILVIGLDQGLALFGGNALLVLACCSLFLLYSFARNVDAPLAFLATIGVCERNQLVASTSPHSPITIGDVRRAERHCEELAEQAPQREADSRTRAEQNAVLSASADPS